MMKVSFIRVFLSVQLFTEESQGPSRLSSGVRIFVPLLLDLDLVQANTKPGKLDQ